ncbi:hypothetical protein J3R83DRAFT_2889 [Lanmaoa asiatica]|nr:hypothetical protein J3R83DRAFT_2889 [Lanmaoa asiatica]
MSLGCKTTLGRSSLSHAQLLAVAATFRRGDIPEQPRQQTPPQVTLDTGSLGLPDARTVNTEAGASIPLTKLDFILHPVVKGSVKVYHAVFKIGSGWCTGYDGHLCWTAVPDPLQLASGETVPSSHLAVSLIARTKGAKILQNNIHEKFLTPFSPFKKGTLCMVIEAKKGGDGESVSMVLSVTVSSKSKQYVSVA